MTKSFDDAVSKHKNNLIENLSQFNEAHRARGLLMDIESNKSDYEYYFNAGQQSKQDEVDELQKRIDGALKSSKEFYDFGDGESAMAFYNEIMNILKGDSHES